MCPPADGNSVNPITLTRRAYLALAFGGDLAVWMLKSAVVLLAVVDVVLQAAAELARSRPRCLVRVFFAQYYYNIVFSLLQANFVLTAYLWSHYSHFVNTMHAYISGISLRHKQRSTSLPVDLLCSCSIGLNAGSLARVLSTANTTGIV